MSTDPSGAAGSVLLLGTTAPPAISLGNSEWLADLEYVWRTRTAPERERLDRRARRLRGKMRDFRRDESYGEVGGSPRRPLSRYVVACSKSAEWCEERARAIAMARADVAATCDQRWRSFACGCTSYEVRVGCDQPQLCERCRKRHASKWRRRITKGIDAAVVAARREWWNTPRYRRRGMMPGIYLITLTGPHSGDLATDRDRLGVAVRKLLKHAERWGWWKSYALTWEATNGTRGDGHMHVHLAVVSSWIPYTTIQATDNDPRSWAPRTKGERRYVQRGLHEVWADAMPGSIQPDVQPPRRGADDAASAGGYLAKYVTKGIDPIEFTGRKAGELLVAFRCRRKVSTSAGFWRDENATCSCCGSAFRATEAPCSLQDIAPGAVLRATAERLRWWIPRGDPQVALRWPTLSLKKDNVRAIL